MKRRIVILFVGLIFTGLNTLVGQENVHITDYVDPFIGTGGHGHTYPGATYPFGMVQVSPDTRLEGWDGCSGYHASDTLIYGFSHTHLSGTGCSDYGDILLMPVSGEAGLRAYSYASAFDPSSEKASPGYYRVKLDPGGIGVELTATPRTGLHRYTYPGPAEPGVVVNLSHRDKVITAGLKIVDRMEIEGFRFSTAWAREQRVYFVIRFSRPFQEITLSSGGEKALEANEISGEDIQAFFHFPGDRRDHQVLVKVGISAVSTEGARKNLEAENPGWDFDQVHKQTLAAWTHELKKIQVSGGTHDQMTVFYTALYHAMLSPDLYMDADGHYLGRDLETHHAGGFDYYTVFSLWDTYRALHPLLTIIDQKRTNDFIRTFIRQYREGGLLPVWELSANETFCMIGYHAVPVIADAYRKGIRGYDAETAFEAMKHSANQDHFGLYTYRTQGFVSADQEGESVSKTLEYAYDDWCIAMMAKTMGKEEDYQTFIRRAQHYKNLFDPSTGFMRAKMNHQWFTPFDPYEVNYHYTEANAWQYGFYVPQDIPGLIDLMGGPTEFTARLDELFSANTQITGRVQADITGLIGQYAHGNEPSHHMAYLYDVAGQPWKTQELVHRIRQEFYSNQRDGLCGNEDCGQLSAWYVFSALGFYPVTPGSGMYAIGTPLFPQAVIFLENGNTFTITADNLNDENFYIQSCTLNGNILEVPAISHEEIMKGGELVFEMGSQPNYDWGVASESSIRSLQYAIEDYPIQPVPFVSQGETTFFDSTVIVLSSPDPKAKIYIRAMSHGAPGISKEGSRVKGQGSREDELSPDHNDFQLFTGPIPIHETTTIRAFTQREGGERSLVIEFTFYKIPKNRKIRLNTGYAPQYSAGGDVALIDFRKGGGNFRTGLWQGYEGVDLDAVVDLGQTQEVRRISVGFLQDAGSWIFFPVEVEFFTSVDGETFVRAGISIHEMSQKDFTPRTLEQWTDLDPPVLVRYVRVVAKNQAICPDWHPGAGKPCWIFVDEIRVE